MGHQEFLILAPNTCTTYEEAQILAPDVCIGVKNQNSGHSVQTFGGTIGNCGTQHVLDKHGYSRDGRP